MKSVLKRFKLWILDLNMEKDVNFMSFKFFTWKYARYACLIAHFGLM
jgi:hypothetical protein